MVQAHHSCEVLPRIIPAKHDVGTCPFADALGSQPLPCAPRGGSQDGGGRQAGVVKLLHFVSDPAVLDHAPCICARIDADTGFKGLEHPFTASLPKPGHVLGVDRKLRCGLDGDIRKSRYVYQRRNNRDRLLHETGNVTGQKAGGVLNAVNPGVEHVINGVFSEAVGSHPGPFVVGGRNGIPHDVPREGNRKVTGTAINPIAYEFDPTVPVPGFLADCLHEFARLHFVTQATQVTPAPGDVASGTKQPWEILPPLNPTCIAWRAGVTDQQRAGF